MRLWAEERKAGIADFQRIVAGGLSPMLLVRNGIESMPKTGSSFSWIEISTSPICGTSSRAGTPLSGC